MRNITIGQYYPADSILHKLDPRVKFLGTLVFIVSLFLIKGLAGYAFVTVVLVTLVKLSKVPFGMMLKGMKAESVFGCPKCARERTDNWDGNHITGYNYNVCYLGYVENDSGKRNYPTSRDSVICPERVVVFGDGGYAGGPNKFMRAPFQDKQYDASSAGLRKAGTQAFRHGRGRARHCNMAFADGHVEEFHQPYKAGGKPGWVDEKTHTAFISSGNGIYGPRGFGVEDNDEPRP